MNNKEKFIMRYRKNQMMVDRLRIKIESLEEKSNKMRSSNLTGMPRGGTVKSPYDLINEKCDLEARTSVLVEQGKIYKKEICEKIDMLEDERYADVLELYAIDGLDYHEIASELGYSERHVRRLYQAAMEELKI